MEEHLLETLFSKDRQELLERLKAFLISEGYESFTIWEAFGGNLCVPAANLNGIDDGTYDIFDLGYGKDNMDEILVPNTDRVISKAFFCKKNEECFYVITFHTPIPPENCNKLKLLCKYVAVRAGEIREDEQKISLFIDYQKKINFVKDAAHILKALAVNDVIAHAIHFFNQTFQAEVSCVFYEDNFVGYGITEDEVRNTVFIDDMPLMDYCSTNKSSQFIDINIKSIKYNINNIFIILDPETDAVFLLFNIVVDVLPDKEFSSLIGYIVTIAIANSKYHEIHTKYKVEEAEMSQTVDILNQFVTREEEVSAECEIFSVNYPAKSTGGDFSTVINRNGYTFICVADVCGKGYAGAVFTVMLATIMESGLYKNLENLPELVNGINNYLLSRNFNDRFITGFFCLYDKKSKKLKYISCGHEPTMLLKSDQVLRLSSKNMPMGLIRENYDTQEVAISKGDLLFLYTDGVIEYIDHDKLQSELEELKDNSPRTIVKSLYNELVVNPSEQKDDFTCVAVKF